MQRRVGDTAQGALNQQLLRAGVEQEELTILRGTSAGYERLETDLLGETNLDITIEAETPGVSTFVVTGDGTDAAFAEDDPEQEPEPEPEDETPVDEPDSQPGFSAVVALVALLAVALLARRPN